MAEERPADSVIAALRDARSAEKAQTVFYRRLAAAAEERGDGVVAERLNGLLADEQHHLSRISARLLEWGHFLQDEAVPPGPEPTAGWEEVAREREEAEIERYAALLDDALDGRTRRMIAEILEVERRHAEALGGKWMEA